MGAASLLTHTHTISDTHPSSSTGWGRSWSKGKWAASTSHLFPDPGRSLCLVAARRTMAGNWERSEGVPVGRTMLKTRAVTRLVQVDTGPLPWAVGTGLFKTTVSLLFEMFWRVWFQMSGIWREGVLDLLPADVTNEHHSRTACKANHVHHDSLRAMLSSHLRARSLSHLFLHCCLLVLVLLCSPTFPLNKPKDPPRQAGRFWVHAGLKQPTTQANTPELKHHKRLYDVCVSLRASCAFMCCENNWN